MVVSNDFGSVRVGVFPTDVWMVGENVTNLVLWLDASREDSFELNNSIIQNWKDLSGQGNDMNITDGNASLTGLLNGRSVASTMETILLPPPRILVRIWTKAVIQSWP